MSESRAVLEGLLRLAMADAQRIGRARRRNALLYVLAGVAGLTAYACAVAAAVLWVVRHADPVLGAGVVALAFAALALTVLAVVAVLNRRERRWMHERAEFYRGAGSTLARAVLGPRLSALAAAAMMLGAVFGQQRTDDPPPGPDSGPRV
ncbi:MAG: hypothetical protein ACXIVG_10105 [Pararhodobacter sp.]